MWYWFFRDVQVSPWVFFFLTFRYLGTSLSLFSFNLVLPFFFSGLEALSLTLSLTSAVYTFVPTHFFTVAVFILCLCYFFFFVFRLFRFVIFDFCFGPVYIYSFHPTLKSFVKYCRELSFLHINAGSVVVINCCLQRYIYYTYYTA